MVTDDRYGEGTDSDGDPPERAVVAAADGGSEGAKTDGDEDDGPSPAGHFGLRIGVPLALVAVAWSFVGPAHLLEIGRYEWPIVASVVEPLPIAFFAYIGGVVFLFAFFGSLAFPIVVDADQDEYAIEMAIDMLLPTVGAAILIVVYGYLVRVLFHAVTGAFFDAASMVLFVALIGVVVLLFKERVLIALLVASAPLWIPSFLGTFSGKFLGDLVA